MSLLYLTVEVPGGAGITETARAAVDLASRLGVVVRFEFSGKQLSALPGSDPSALVNEYWRAFYASKWVRDTATLKQEEPPCTGSGWIEPSTLSRRARELYEGLVTAAMHGNSWALEHVEEGAQVFMDAVKLEQQEARLRQDTTMKEVRL